MGYGAVQGACFGLRLDLTLTPRPQHFAAPSGVLRPGGVKRVRSIPCPLCGSTAHRVVSRLAGPYSFRARTVICRECGFLFRARPWDEKEAAAFHQRLSRHLAADNGRASGLCELGVDQERRARRRLRWLRAYVPSPARVLGLGDDSSVFVEAARAVGYDASSIDGDRSAVAAAGRQSAPGRAGLPESADRLTESFDAVALFSVLERVPDLHQAIAMVSRLLKRDGYLIVEVPDTMRMEVRPRDYFLPDRNWHFTACSLGLLLAKEGLAEGDILQRRTGDGNVLFAATRQSGVSDEMCIRNPLEYQRVLAYLQEARGNSRLTPEVLSRDVLSVCLGPWLGMRAFLALQSLAYRLTRRPGDVPVEALLGDAMPVQDRATP